MEQRIAFIRRDYSCEELKGAITALMNDLGLKFPRVSVTEDPFLPGVVCISVTHGDVHWFVGEIQCNDEKNTKNTIGVSQFWICGKAVFLVVWQESSGTGTDKKESVRFIGTRGTIGTKNPFDVWDDAMKAAKELAFKLEDEA